jgi:hypothetical protein
MMINFNDNEEKNVAFTSLMKLFENPIEFLIRYFENAKNNIDLYYMSILEARKYKKSNESINFNHKFVIQTIEQFEKECFFNMNYQTDQTKMQKVKFESDIKNLYNRIENNNVVKFCSNFYLSNEFDELKTQIKCFFLLQKMVLFDDNSSQFIFLENDINEKIFLVKLENVYGNQTVKNEILNELNM